MFLYRIFYKNDLLYIGSTIDIDRRKAEHKSQLKCGVNDPLYRYLRENNIKFDDLKFEEILCRGLSIEGLRYTEGNYIRFMNPIINTRIEGGIYINDKKKYHKEYRELNAEKLKNQKKEYRLKNIEKEKERHKKWCENNSEKIKINTKKYRELNAEKLKQKSKEYREKNPEKEKERLKKWCENNREKLNQKSKQYYQQNRDILKEKQQEQRQLNKIFNKIYNHFY